ncbi:DNA repair protein RadC [Thiospirochaeta perfilievii]|uniref:DNA repair protein RadC n=1 Tax=Thiospirochaeta perfilievii TaxID=252967 RepID=A0A5C1QCY1_9SPIO|nr:DNA repair protein RadC [Thiospirochaeta perfilievii]QEN05421.1 DNA repair protein RadC [Thiospirochaeta perfilievii]
MYRYKNKASSLQPREKAKKYGMKNLSDKELISILLGSGTKSNPIDKLSNKILELIDTSNSELSTEELEKINGIGVAKASMIGASMEFSRRRLTPSIQKISYPTDILPAVRHFVTRPQEYFIVITLNGAHEIIKTRVISIGILNKTLIHPREVFSDALKDRAASLVLAHNHPSGNLEPSNEDKEVTKRLISAGDILGIKILDHIIFSHRSYFSFTENQII